MYRVFEALDELVTIVEEARGVPMTASCVVPRGDVLELLDDVRDALPGEVDDAQDVLDHRDQMIGEANATAAKTVGDAKAEAHRLVSTAQADAERDRHRCPRRGGPAGQEATAHANSLVARAQDEAARIVQSAQDQHDSTLARAHGEAERAVAAGRASYEGSVADGRAEQAGWSPRPRSCRPRTPNRRASWTAPTPTPTGCGRSATPTSTRRWPRSRRR